MLEFSQEKSIVDDFYNYIIPTSWVKLLSTHVSNITNNNDFPYSECRTCSYEFSFYCNILQIKTSEGLYRLTSGGDVAANIEEYFC